jgi:hypothetical protein
MRNLMTLSCAFALLFVFSNIATAGSGPNVTIMSEATDPVEITQAAVADPTDWARSLCVSVRGVAQKPVVCVEVALELPELTSKGKTVTAVYRFGEPKKKKAKTAAPGEIVKANITPDSDRQLEWLVYGRSSMLSPSQSIATPTNMTSAYNARPAPKVTLTRGTLSIARVVFADGTEWVRGGAQK